MLCGDETGGIVVDTGSAITKMGFAGDDTPKAVFDTVRKYHEYPFSEAQNIAVLRDLQRVGVMHVPDESGKAGSTSRKYTVGPSIRTPKAAMEIRSPIDLGISEFLSKPTSVLCSVLVLYPNQVAVEDWDAIERVWEYGFQQLVRTNDLSDHPLLFAEPPYSILSQREKIAEICFEKFNAPAMFLGRSAALGAFSVGRASAIVVDIGASATRVTPVYDGYVLTKGSHLSEVGGTFLSEALQQMLLRSGTASEIRPRYAVKKTPRTDSAEAGAGSKKLEVSAVDVPGIHHTYKAWSELEVVDDIKKAVCEVHETGYDETHPPEAETYELPDGQQLKIKDIRMQIPELMFRTEATEPFKTLVSNRTTPAWLSHFQAQVTLRHSAKEGAAHLPVPLQQAIYAALLSSGAEIRRDMCNNVVLTGGGSNLRHLHRRLHWELLALIPAAFKPRVVAPSALEREFATWIGGSILASLGTFQQMWVSKMEYEDEGPAAVERKCIT